MTPLDRVIGHRRQWRAHRLDAVRIQAQHRDLNGPKQDAVLFLMTPRDSIGLKTVAVGVGGLGRGAQVLGGQRFKFFNGAFWGTIEKLISLIIRLLRSIVSKGPSGGRRRSFAGAQDDIRGGGGKSGRRRDGKRKERGRGWKVIWAEPLVTTLFTPSRGLERLIRFGKMPGQAGHDGRERENDSQGLEEMRMEE